MKMIKKVVPLFLAAVMVFSLAACGSNGTAGSTNSGKEAGSTATEKETGSTPSEKETGQAKAFPKFQGKDFEGNSVDETLFSKNEVTLVNFWFNGCSACVDEMPALEKLNAKLREKGAELIGVNVEAGENEKIVSEAKDILSKQGATYRNLYMSGEEATDYISKIFAFPTTIVVDKKGNIVGDPILGGFESEEAQNEIIKLVEDLMAGGK